MPESEAAAGGRCQVALPVAVDSLFDYALPPSLRDEAEPGRRVLVPFGSRRLTGLIVSCDGSGPAPRTRLRSVIRVLDPEPVLSSRMIDILREAALEVLCPVGIALAAALPPGSSPRSSVRWQLTPRGEEALRSGAARGPAQRLLERLEGGPVAPVALSRLAPDAARRLAALARDGFVTRVEVELGPSARLPSVRFACLESGVDAARASAEQLARAPRQAALLRRLAEDGPAPAAELGRGRPGAAAALRGLVARGLVRIETRELAPEPGGYSEAARRVELTPEQARALATLGEAIDARRDEHFLLHGVTGSGKTEVYLRGVEQALGRGRQALVLVPEITLTHQIVARLRARFGDSLAILHSGLRPGERLGYWRRLREGRTPIAVGARSALFAPLENLGLIVIDEEHDGAYKNEEGFRYHARRLAALRARDAGCPLVLGSATPALETRHAAEHGDLRRLVLPHRIGGQPLPSVEIVDLAHERASEPRGRKLILTRPLRRALGDALRDGGQAILFLNRRGFSTRIFCFECGHAEHCPHCDIALVFHASVGRLRCHYCDHQLRPPEKCSHCGAPDTALLGVGTERVEEEVRARFPDARVARLDRDTAARRGRTEEILSALREHEVDVVIGTQMVAKGHDFPGVRLVGVVAADLGLHHPDFRAAERTFQLLTQVAGRAGRGGAPGRVILQTFVPDHYAIRPVRDHDYERFYREEIRHREALGYPPFGQLVRVVVSGEDLGVTEETARQLAARATQALAGAPDCEILGPAAAPLARLRGRHRLQILVKGADAEGVARAARALADAASSLRAPLQASVDVAPMHML